MDDFLQLPSIGATPEFTYVMNDARSDPSTDVNLITRPSSASTGTGTDTPVSIEAASAAGGTKKRKAGKPGIASEARHVDLERLLGILCSL